MMDVPEIIVIRWLESLLHKPKWSRIVSFPSIVPVLLVACSGSLLYGQTALTLDCGRPHARSIPLTSQTVYGSSAIAGAAGSYGFDLKTLPTDFSNGACSGDSPFFLSFAATDGNYEVTLELGAKDRASNTTVRAESRRLMLAPRSIAAGRSERHTFIVNVRTPAITGTNDAAGAGPSRKVKLKQREIGALDWDDKLTLEFNGSHPSLRSVSIRRIGDVPTLYLAGDSTVVDQDKEPWAAWGQMLPAFFDAGVSIANNAESGETIKSFVGENRLAKIMSTIRSGDYLFVQFAHNDQKPGSGFVSIPDYKDFLRSYIKQARDRGARPILVTSMNRRKFDPSGHIEQTLGEYPAATREMAAEQSVPLLDLNAMSKTLYEAMGEEGTLKAFVHYPAKTYPGQDVELKDDTHFNSYGAYELARCIVESIRDQRLPLATHLLPGTPAFDPAKPDPVATWIWPASPLISTDTPYGR